MIKVKVIVPPSARQKEFMDRIINGIRKQQSIAETNKCSVNYEVIGNDTIIYEFDSIALTPITTLMGGNKIPFIAFKRKCHALSEDIKVERIKA